MFPVYFGRVDFRERRKEAWYRFAGIAVPADRRSCLAGIRRLRGTDSSPLLITLRLPDDWRSKPMYQRFQ
jgi:hypothetical protein